MFRSRFCNNATQREINENTHSQGHGKYYFGRCHKENIAKAKSNILRLFTQFGVLLLGDLFIMPIPLLLAICLNYGWTILPVPLAVLVPYLRSICLNRGWPIIAVLLTILKPLLSSIRFDCGWSIIPVKIAVLIPVL
jgi:hypothetical protein